MVVEMVRNLIEPTIINLQAHIDDRGILWQIFDQEIDLKRIYIIRNHKAGTIRGFHSHKQETKIYFVSQGVAKFIILDPSGVSIKKTYVLSDKNPTIIYIPPTYPHGWINLTDDTILIGLSDKSLEESIKDDIRFEPFILGKEIWKVKSR